MKIREILNRKMCGCPECKINKQEAETEINKEIEKAIDECIEHGVLYRTLDNKSGELSEIKKADYISKKELKQKLLGGDK